MIEDSGKTTRLDQKISQELLQLLHQQATASFPGSLLTAGCIVFALYGVVNALSLWLWFLFVLFVSVLRYMECRLYLYLKPPPSQDKYWFASFVFITILGSISWILAGTVLYPADPLYQALIVFAIVSIVSISVSLFAVSRLVSLLFIFLVTTSFGVKMLLLGDKPHQLLAIFAFIYLIVVSLFSLKIHYAIRSRLRLRLERDELIDRLYVTKGEVETVNTELQHKIKERKQFENLLRNSEEQYRLVTNALPVLIAYIDKDLYFRFNNKAYAEWFHKPLSDIIDQPVKQVFGESGYMTFFDHYQHVLRGEQVTYETTMYFESNQERYVSVTLIPHFQEGGVVGVFSLISDMTPRINYLATHDPLTNLPNRSLFNARLTHALKHATRHGTFVAILFLDLDHFKNVNDTLGHDVGDQLLVKVVDRLKESVSSKDTIARLGGDEFIIILEDDMNLQRATKVAQSICESVANVFNIAEKELYITTSVGISIFPEDGEDMQMLLKNADMAMYRAKERGRNTFEFYTRGMNEAIQKKIFIGTSLRSALEKQELKIYYQPLIDIKKNKITSMEALLRWNHPDMGFISPGEFIPIAEETDLIIPIGEWVLKSAAQQALRWQREGIPSLGVTVNLSARQFMKRDLAVTIARILNETGLEGRFLTVELTETLVMGDIDHSIKIVNDLKNLDIRIALDDFGTGYSSLSYLKRFPLDILKIDRSFVTDFSFNHEDAAIVKAIIALAHNLKMKVIAEGVETPEQYIFLRDHGCDELQGYLFCPPVSEIDATTILFNQPALAIVE